MLRRGTVLSHLVVRSPIRIYHKTKTNCDKMSFVSCDTRTPFVLVISSRGCTAHEATPEDLADHHAALALAAATHAAAAAPAPSPTHAAAPAPSPAPAAAESAAESAADAESEASELEVEFAEARAPKEAKVKRVYVRCTHGFATKKECPECKSVKRAPRPKKAVKLEL